VTFGGIRLGPVGSGNPVGDQHFGFDAAQPSFASIFATEHSIDAYALFNLLFQETGEDKYRKGRDDVLHWLRTVAYNSQEHRFNRGFAQRLDTAVASDVQSWSISALGVDLLDSFEPGLAEKMIAFIEHCCLVDTEFQKPDGPKVKIRGVDFIDSATAARLGRKPLVSPEWTFQLVNAYRRIESDLSARSNVAGATLYRRKREDLTKSILGLAIPTATGWAYPYATQGGALTGHEYRTPADGTLSTIGAAYAILAVSGFDPLGSASVVRKTQKEGGKGQRQR